METPQKNKIADNTSTDGLWTTEQAAEWLGFTARMLEARRQHGNGPSYVRISARAVRYFPGDVRSWAANRLKMTISEKQ